LQYQENVASRTQGEVAGVAVAGQRPATALVDDDVGRARMRPVRSRPSEKRSVPLAVSAMVKFPASVEVRPVKSNRAPALACRRLPLPPFSVAPFCTMKRLTCGAELGIRAERCASGSFHRRAIDKYVPPIWAHSGLAAGVVSAVDAILRADDRTPLRSSRMPASIRTPCTSPAKAVDEARMVPPPEMRDAVKGLSTRLFEMAMTVRADIGLDSTAPVFRPASVLPRMSPTESINETRPEDALLSVSVEFCEFTVPTRVPSTVILRIAAEREVLPDPDMAGTTIADAPLVRSTAAASMEARESARRVQAPTANGRKWKETSA
jgi:hypothetical protein